jgi:hypothetical protein
MTEHILNELITALKNLKGDPRVIQSMEAWGKSAPSKELLTDIYSAFENTNAPRELLATIGSWTDTLCDEEILKMLAQWNRERKPSIVNGHSKWPAT